MPDIFDRFYETIETRKMIKQGDRILLSLSAGKDSMALLDLLIRYKNINYIELGIFHLNHLTRGYESDADEIMVTEKAKDHGIRLFSRKYNFTSAAKGGVSFEEHAREIRYMMLREIAGTEGYNKIATAHNSMDNIETMLMRIFSGTGIFGLRGISYVIGNIIRPLLDIHPDEIYSYLKEKKINWREDHTNSENKYMRNYVRNSILPLIKERFTGVEKNIKILSDHASENEQLLSFLTGKVNTGWLTETGEGHFISTGSFADNIPFVKYMLTRALYNHYGIKLNSAILNEIIRRFGYKKSNIILYEKGNIVISRRFKGDLPGIDICDITKKTESPEKWEHRILLEKMNSVFIPELKKFFNYRESSHEEFLRLKNDKRYIFMKMPENSTDFILRNRRPGDRIEVEKCIKKIKDLMIEKKLDISTKKSVPLIVINDEIAAYLPGAVGPYPDRVSCNFWVNGCSERIFEFYFSDFSGCDISEKQSESAIQE